MYQEVIEEMWKGVCEVRGKRKIGKSFGNCLWFPVFVAMERRNPKELKMNEKCNSKEGY